MEEKTKKVEKQETIKEKKSEEKTKTKQRKTKEKVQKQNKNERKKKEKESVEINNESYEKITLSDYKFPIILLSIIIVTVILMPFIFKGVQKLEEMNLFENIFKKESTQTTPNTNEKDNDDNKIEVVTADKSGANSPVLKNGMIPVRYNYIENKWVKADSSNPSTNSWYNYNNKEWANAILVRENGTKTRKYYENATPDTIINNEDILAFFVWIPRYKYSLVSNTGLQQIDITFEEKTATKTTGPNYITHPAFTFNGEELSGIWVGKFEVTGHMGELTILPNTYAVTNQNILSMYNNIQNMYGNNYGLNSENSNIRLMKNIEWGAVTYLTNSKYGICKNSSCSKMTTYNFDYNSETGMTSSTTGNVTGVYAMNGSVMEYVMGNNNGVVGSSGFDTVWMSQNKKYYDTYSDGKADDYTRGILGDATKEFGSFTNNVSSWNSSHSVFVNSTSPWFIRDINNSIYSFSNYTGAAHNQVGFRLSLN